MSKNSKLLKAANVLFGTQVLMFLLTILFPLGYYLYYWFDNGDILGALFTLFLYYVAAIITGLILIVYWAKSYKNKSINNKVSYVLAALTIIMSVSLPPIIDAIPNVPKDGYKRNTLRSTYRTGS